MQLTRSTIAQLCRRFGPALKLPATISGEQLLWALAGNESTFGLHCSPRHESGYCRGGRYFEPTLTSLWGCLAHCSYGPFQVMYPNISRGGNVDPRDVLRIPEIGANAAAQFINERILGHEKAATLEQIADAYNSGDWRDDNRPAGYIAELVKNYAVPMAPEFQGPGGKPGFTERT
jgi:(2Fe-2S) ferredoxin